MLTHRVGILRAQFGILGGGAVHSAAFQSFVSTHVRIDETSFDENPNGEQEHRDSNNN